MVNLYVPTKEEKKALLDLSVVILTPCKDYEVATKFLTSVTNMVAYSWLHGLRVFQIGVSERTVVHWARNDLARLAQEFVSGYTGQRYSHILWLDDDHVFNPDLALYLARHSHLDMVSALYYGRVGRHLPVIYVKDDSPDKYSHYPLIEVPRTLFEVDAIGFGSLLMRMDVLDRMEKPWFRFDRCGEDIYFCVHAKERGIRIYCDGGYLVQHIGEPKIIGHAENEAYMREKAQEYADRVKVPLGGRNGSGIGI